jgi:hypothetical protein
MMIGLLITAMLDNKDLHINLNKPINLNSKHIGNIEDKFDIISNNEDKVNKLVNKIIHKNKMYNDFKKKSTNEIDKQVKYYFDSNLNEATKIFKTMLKNK